MQRITYTDPSCVLESLRLESYFPLTNLHWGPGDRPLRTIPKLRIELAPNDPKKAQHQILGLSDNPLMQLYFVECDSYDAFKPIRKQVQEWAKHLNVRDPMGHLVVHVVRRGNHKSKNVWAKLQSDHGDHAAQIYDEDCTAFVALLKTHILQAFSDRVYTFETEIRTLQSTRDIVGWNFGRLFVVKESLATCFESMGFLDEAYQIYLELERMTEPDFFTAKVDSTAPLVRTAIFESMLTQTASTFEFHVWLFVREIELLVALSQHENTPSVRDRHLAVAAQRAILWIPKLSQMLEKSKCPPLDIISWQMETAKHVYKLVVQHSSNTIVDSRGQLLLLQRDALVSLASAKKFSVPGVSANVPLTDQIPAYPESQEAFEKEFFEITQEAVEVLGAAGMTRSVSSLKAQLAHIDYECGRYQAAFEVLEHLPATYSEFKWYDIATDLYVLLLNCAEKLERPDTLVKVSWELLKFPLLNTELSQRCVGYIEAHKTIKHTEQASQWLDIKVSPYLRGDGRYYLEAAITPKTARPFPDFSSCTMLGKIGDNHGNKRQIVFRREQGNKFYTTTLVDGTAELSALSLSLGAQTLQHALKLKVPLFMMANCVHGSLRLANSFTSTKRNLELELKSPVPISAKVKILAVDGLQILHEKMEATSLDNFTTAKIVVPALTRVDQPLARVRIAVEHSGTEGSTGYLEFTRQIDMSLDVLVHAQEFFRENGIIQQFLVSSSSTPVILERAELKGDDAEPITRPQQHVILDGAPASLLYRFTQSHALEFELVYRSVRQECEQLVWQALALEDSPYSLILKEALSAVLVGSVSYVIHGKFKVDPEDIQELFEGALSCIEPADRASLRASVQSALASELTKNDCDFSALNSALLLSVPPPDRLTVHYVDLEIDSTVLTLGVPTKARLSIRTSSDRKFSFELDKFNCDGWLFTGACRTEFTGNFEQDIWLIPAKAGKLDMAVVEIYSDEMLNIEVVQRQKGEQVTVLPVKNQLTLAF